MGLQVAEGSRVFCISKNEAESPVEMIIYFCDLNNVGNPGSGYFGDG
jgi:hypothetical protein